MEVPTSQPPSVMSELLDEMDTAALPKPGVASPHHCPNCHVVMHPHAVLCVQCGHNRQTGKTLKTKRDVAQRPPERETDVSLSSRSGTAPSFEKEVSIDSLFDTTSEVLFNPSHTFHNLVLRGNWAAPCIYVCGSYVLAALASLIMAVGWAFLQIRGQVNWEVLADHSGDIAIALAICGGIIVVGQFFCLLFQSSVMHLLVIATGQHRGGFETTLKVNGYVSGAIVWLSLIPIIGMFLLIILFPTHMVIGLSRAHRIGIPRSLFVFAASFVLSIVLAYMLAMFLADMMVALFQFA